MENSNDSSNVVIGILGIILIILAGFLGFIFFANASDQEDSTENNTQDESTNDTSIIPDSSVVNNGDNTDNIAGEPADESDNVTINITGMSYPSEITIKPGTTVIWNNQDMDHTVTLNDIDVESGVFRRGETFQHTFTEVGEFDYRCEIHPTMRGTIVVEQ